MRRMFFTALAIVLSLAGTTSHTSAQDGPKPQVPDFSSSALMERAHTLRRPKIPAEALNAGTFGTVAVRVSIAPDGEILSARAVAGPPILREAAVEAARSWEFRGAEIPDNTQGFLIFRFDFGEPYATVISSREGDTVAEAPPPPRPVVPEQSTSVRDYPENDVVVPILPAQTLPPKSARTETSRPAAESTPVFDPALLDRAVRRVSPQYPPAAASARIEGVVVVEVIVNESGKVSSAKAVSGPAVLREAAASAARQWTFTPARRDDAPVKSTGRITFNFRRS